MAFFLTPTNFKDTDTASLGCSGGAFEMPYVDLIDKSPRNRLQHVSLLSSHQPYVGFTLKKNTRWTRINFLEHIFVHVEVHHT